MQVKQEIAKVNKDAYIIYKEIGQTPLEALEQFRTGHGIAKDVPMTYAGRLDPMAEGQLLVLIGEECKNKEKYLGLDKEYEVEIIFGIGTDTYDALGLITSVGPLVEVKVEKVMENLGSFPKSYEQKYPPYSSKTHNGTQLHQLARTDELPEEMPTRNVTLYSIKILGSGDVSARELKESILRKIALVHGDFRQKEIKESWEHFFLGKKDTKFPFIRLQVKCSSGTYMRSLAHELGKSVGTGAFALSIKRTRIFNI